MQPRTDTRHDGVGNHERAMGVGRNDGPTTDHDGRTQRTSTVSHDTSYKWFALDTRRGLIWGSRDREFKSRQPDK
jgi:hypothetical protein